MMWATIITMVILIVLAIVDVECYGRAKWPEREDVGQYPFIGGPWALYRHGPAEHPTYGPVSTVLKKLKIIS